MAANETVSLLVKLLADGIQFAKTMDDAKKKAQKTGQDIAKAVQDIAQPVATAGLAIGGGIVAGFALAAKAASDFDSAFAKITTQLKGEYSEPAFIKGLKDGIFEIAKETGIAVPDAIEAVYTALQAGIPEKNVLEFVKTGGKAAVAGVTDLASVMDVTTSVMDAYAMSAEKAQYIQDVLFKGVDIGKIEFRDFSQYLGQVLPVAKAAGVSFEDLIGTIAALTRSGFKPATAIEAIRSALSNVLKPTEQAKKAADALGVEFSVTALQAQGFDKFMNNLFQTMNQKVDWKLIDEAAVTRERKKLATVKKDIEKTTAALADPKNLKKKPALTKKLEELNLKSKESEATLVKLHTTAAEELDKTTGAAQLFGDVTGLASVLALGNENANMFNESLKETNNAAGATGEAFEKMKANNPEADFKKMSATIQEFMVNAGRPLLEKVFAPLARAITSVVTSMGEFSKEHPNVAAGATVLVGVVGGLALILGSLAFVLGKVAGLYLIISGASASVTAGFTGVAASGGAAGAGAAAAGAGATAGAVGFGAMAVAIWAALVPILLIAAKIALVVAAAYALYKALVWLAEAQFTKDFFDWLVAVWDDVAKAWDDAMRWLGEWFDEAGTFIEDFGTYVAETFEDMGTDIQEGLRAALDWVIEKFQAIWDKIKEVAAAAADFINPFNDGGASSASATSSSMPRYGSGGIVTRPQVAMVGEAGPEAIIPLKGGGVPVLLSGGESHMGSNRGGKGQQPITVNVYPTPNQSPAQIADEVARVISRRRGTA